MRSSKRSQRPKAAALLVGHGSRAKGFDGAMKKIAASLQRRSSSMKVSCAFLEIAEPSISDEIERLITEGSRRIRVIPFFVHLGRHVLADIPQILRTLKKKHPQVTLELSPYLGFDDGLVDLVAKRMKQTDLRFR